MPDRLLFNGRCRVWMHKTTSTTYPFAITVTTDRSHNYVRDCTVYKTAKAALRAYHNICRLLLAPIDKII